MPLPQARTLRDAGGFRWLVTVDRGRLVLSVTDGSAEPIIFDDPTELRWFGMQLHRAAVEYDAEVQFAAVKASVDRRAARARAGQPTGLRHGPYIEPADPPLHATQETA